MHNGNQTISKDTSDSCANTSYGVQIIVVSAYVAIR